MSSVQIMWGHTSNQSSDISSARQSHVAGGHRVRQHNSSQSGNVLAWSYFEYIMDICMILKICPS